MTFGLRRTLAALGVAWTLGALPAETVAQDAMAEPEAPAPLQPRVAATADLDTPVDASRALAVKVGQSVAIDLPSPITDVIVAEPNIADVVVKRPTKVFVLGRAPGSTNMFFLDEEGDVVLNARVFVEADVAQATRLLRQLQPDSRIDLKAVNGSIVMSGWTPSAQAAADAEAVVRGFIGTDGAIVNALKVAGDQQVLLQVRVAEIQRNTLKTLGVNTDLDIGNGTLETISGLAGGINFSTLGTLSVGKWGIDEIVFSTLEREGLVKVLAEPALTAISGETANFLAGGEYPTPVGLTDEGDLAIEFREFGVSLSFTPVVLANDQISLRIATEVSRIADENQIILPGTNVPIRGLSVRRAQSTVMMPSGGALMIAGLLQNDEINNVEGVPGLMDLPILGSLFRSTSFQNNRSELVVVVRAFQVHPVEFGPKLAYPTDGFVPASDLDIYMFGRLRKTYGGVEAVPGEPHTVAGPVGYMMR